MSIYIMSMVIYEDKVSVKNLNLRSLQVKYHLKERKQPQVILFFPHNQNVTDVLIEAHYFWIQDADNVHENKLKRQYLTLQKSLCNSMQTMMEEQDTKTHTTANQNNILVG